MPDTVEVSILLDLSRCLLPILSYPGRVRSPPVGSAVELQIRSLCVSSDQALPIVALRGRPCCHKSCLALVRLS